MRVIINGACGRMGVEVEKLLLASEKHEIAAKIDKFGTGSDVLSDINDFSGEADVIIDFSNHLATEELMAYAANRKIPVVVSTTGHTDEELEMINEAAKQVAVFHSANMSLGVALLCELAVKTASLMPEADIEIVETHHNRKLDAPSGTALMIARAIKTVRDNALFKLGRAGNAKREKEEIGIHAVRRGNIVGIHEVHVSTDNQTITIKHEAHSRALFAEGAVSAAEFIASKPAGLYTMNNLVK